MKKLMFTILLIGFSFLGISQYNYDFMVLGTKGKNYLDGNEIKVGQVIQASQKVVVDEYLGLAHISGKTLEIKIAGSFLVSDLSKNIDGDENIFHRYASFVISELKQEKPTNKYANKGKTGAVYRAVKNKPIQFMLPEKSFVYPQDNISISWKSIIPSKSYKFRVLDMMNNILYETVVSDTIVNVNLNDIDINSKINVIYEVESLDSINIISPRQMISKIGKDTKKAIKNDLKNISSDTAMDYINRAIIFEEYALFPNALDCYVKALESNESVFIKNVYEAFLQRNKFK